MAEFIKRQQVELNVTTLYVTHDQEEAMSLADRLIVMKDGVIQQTGTPALVYDNPANLFVADFIGSPGMNQFEGRIINENNKSYFQAGDYRLELKNRQKSATAILAIRPEFVHADKNSDLSGQVLMNEYQGSYRVIHIDSELGRILMRVNPDKNYKNGDSLQLTLNQDRCCYFNKESGERL